MLVIVIKKPILGKIFVNCAVRCVLKHDEIAEWRENVIIYGTLNVLKRYFPSDKNI